MTPEGKVKKKLREFLKTLGPEVWCHMPVPTGYSDKGTPDFLICFYGTFLAIETKANGNTPTPLQHLALTNIQKARGIAMVINDTNIDDSIQCLQLLAHTLSQTTLATESARLANVPPYG